MNSRPLAFLLTLALLASLPFAGCKPSTHEHSESTPGKAAKYHCPMHPSIVSDKPGTCPICSMDLVPIGRVETPGKSQNNSQIPKSDVPGAAVISISPEKRQLLGVTLGTVEKQPFSHEIRTSARIVSDETRLWRVSTKVEGWVEQLFVSYTGQKVQKGDPLLTVYSPDLVAAQAEYLSALRSQARVSSGAGITDTTQSLVNSARRRLELWDISDAQIEQLTRTGTVQKALTLHAPASGVVLERNISAGQKLTPGNPLMLIADLSVVWADADIYQSDLQFIHEGMPLEVSLPFWPGKSFEGKVIFLSPTLDEQSRTLRARLEIPNPKGVLKPGMFADAHLFQDLGETLSIPASAVMRGGRQTYAFRDMGDGHLVPVSIQIGARSADRFQLLGGLKEGDRVVTSANFLVDSESNLKAALEAVTDREGSGAPAATPHQHSPGGAAPSTAPGHESSSSNEPKSDHPSPEHFKAGLPAYLRLQAALAGDDLNLTRAAAADLSKAGIPEAAAIADAGNLEAARSPFVVISEQFISSVRKLGNPSQSSLYLFECPMANNNRGARWVQGAPEIRNPYFGSSMLKCGESKGTVNPGGVQ